MNNKQKEGKKGGRPGGIPEDPKIKDAMSKVRHKIAIISNKGGVGKSMLAVNLAVALAQNDKNVGLLDVDIHGPSVPKMMGLDTKDSALAVKEQKIIPAEAHGVKVISMGFVIQDKDAPIIWRGPMKTNVIRQFIGDTQWGELDYLIIDSPPGTGDEPLTIFQMLPGVDGSIIITTPQELALLDSRKAVRFAQALNIPVLGIVENMSWLTCPHCKKQVDLFKPEKAFRAAEEMGIDLLGTLPFDVPVVTAGDRGVPIVIEREKSPIADELFTISDKVIKRLP